MNDPSYEDIDAAEAITEEADLKRDDEFGPVTVITPEGTTEGMLRGNEIILTPNYENTAKFFASALSSHDFDLGQMTPVFSFMEQAVYLSHKDPDAYARLRAWMLARMPEEDRPR